MLSQQARRELRSQTYNKPNKQTSQKTILQSNNKQKKPTFIQERRGQKDQNNLQNFIQQNSKVLSSLLQQQQQQQTQTFQGTLDTLENIQSNQLLDYHQNISNVQPQPLNQYFKSLIKDELVQQNDRLYKSNQALQSELRNIQEQYFKLLDSFKKLQEFRKCKREKLVITNEVFENGEINNDIKVFLRKLTNNCSVMERENEVLQSSYDQIRKNSVGFEELLKEKTSLLESLNNNYQENQVKILQQIRYMEEQKTKFQQENEELKQKEIEYIQQIQTEDKSKINYVQDLQTLRQDYDSLYQKHQNLEVDYDTFQQKTIKREKYFRNQIESLEFQVRNIQKKEVKNHFETQYIKIKNCELENQNIILKNNNDPLEFKPKIQNNVIKVKNFKRSISLNGPGSKMSQKKKLDKSQLNK